MKASVTNKTKKIAVLSTLFLASAIIGLCVLLYLINDKQKELWELAVSRIQREAERIELSSLEQLLSNTNEERQKLESHILHEEKVTSFLSGIEEAGRLRDVTISTESLSIREREAENASFESLAIKFELTGRFTDILEFIEFLEQVPYDLNVEQLMLSYVEVEGMRTWNGTAVVEVTKSKSP